MYDVADLLERVESGSATFTSWFGFPGWGFATKMRVGRAHTPANY
jgi:hypothetical protein